MLCAQYSGIVDKGERSSSRNASRRELWISHSSSYLSVMKFLAAATSFCSLLFVFFMIMCSLSHGTPHSAGSFLRPAFDFSRRTAADEYLGMKFKFCGGTDAPDWLLVSAKHSPPSSFYLQLRQP